MSIHRYFATCAKGLESVLARELTALGAEDVQPGRGGADFAGEADLLYRANLGLRTAVRVLRPIIDAPLSTRMNSTTWFAPSIGPHSSRRTTPSPWIATFAIPRSRTRSTPHGA